MSLKQIFELINASKVAAECFQKSRSWLHQRINGDLVNGKPAELTNEQRKQLAAYLRQKAGELTETARLLEQEGI